MILRVASGARNAAPVAIRRVPVVLSPVRHSEIGIVLHIYHMHLEAQPVLLSKHMNINSLQSNQKDS
jgi:hypothetical protein